MFEILHPILDWLSTKHGSSTRSGYGWQTVVMFAVVIAGMLKANEVRSKNVSLKNKTFQQLLNNPLFATIYTEQNDQTLQNYAKLEKANNAYIVTIDSAATPKSKSRQELNSLEEVEAFLAKYTIFKISDFKQCTRQA